MPIKFRCPHCEQFLGISRNKAGSVTDCPTCGRTIRVPDLEGHVAPLPKPKLNHGDSGLANALDALAALENGESLAAPIPLPQKPVVVPVAAAPMVTAVPLPAPAMSAPVKPPGTPVEPARRDDEALASLATLPVNSPSTPQGRPRPRPWLWPAACGVIGLTLGVGIGRMTASPSAGTNSNSAPVVADSGKPGAVPPGGAPPLADAPANGEPVVPLPEPGVPQRALEGRITYIATTGESRPDAGARILVIPAKHPNVAKLAVVSFRSGAGANDVRLAQASIRAIGGDFAVADADGRYSITLPSQGQYRVLIGSRYQARSIDSAPPADGLKALEPWFDQPRAFFGSTQSTLADIPFDGSHASVRDQVFQLVD